MCRVWVLCGTNRGMGTGLRKMTGILVLGFERLVLQLDPTESKHIRSKRYRSEP